MNIFNLLATNERQPRAASPGFTPRKTPRTRCQSLSNDVGESHSAVKRKLADVTNQLGSICQPQKRSEAPEDIENRVRKTGCHFLIEYGLFPFTAIHALPATDEDPTFSEDKEFDSENSRIQGQLRDGIALLPADAKAIRRQK
ncbi:hypothetical protein DFH07DRAFT_781263 [Mycena maculata]|uniref:Uncharacterized protein n=1 Tax=Mycena maculata TaxID=230809 RepID=A0AAD7HZ95_9AGAR|nr:hypothetical protein DFH07DRAFT_781263 [Mycena maculata]